MKSIFRHFRQVKIVRRGNAQQPHVSGVEEVWYDGRGKVRYWHNEHPSRTEEFLGEPRLTWRVNHWLDENSFPWSGWWEPSDPMTSREISDTFEPITVVTQPSSTTHRSSGSGQPLSKLRQTWNQGSEKLQRMARRLPTALQTAWQELVRDD